MSFRDYFERIEAMTHGDRRAAADLFAECGPHLLMTGSTPFGRYRSARPRNERDGGDRRVMRHAVAAARGGGAADIVLFRYGELTRTVLREFAGQAGETPGFRPGAIAARFTAPARRFAAQQGIGVLPLEELEASAIDWDAMLSCLDRIARGQPPAVRMRLAAAFAA